MVDSAVAEGKRHERVLHLNLESAWDHSDMRDEETGLMWATVDDDVDATIYADLIRVGMILAKWGYDDISVMKGGEVFY